MTKIKQVVDEYAAELWKVLRNECSFAEKAAIVKYPYKEGDKVSFWADNIIQNVAYDKLVALEEIDINKVFNLATGDYENSMDKTSRPNDLGRRGNGHFVYVNSEWKSIARKSNLIDK